MASSYAGLWISGADKNYYSIGHDLASFTLPRQPSATRRATLSLASAPTGQEIRLWAGVWRAGTDANYFSVDKDITEFTDCDQAPRQGSAPRRHQTYVEAGKRLWAGCGGRARTRTISPVDKDLDAFTQLANTQRPASQAYADPDLRFGSGAQVGRNLARRHVLELLLRRTRASRASSSLRTSGTKRISGWSTSRRMKRMGNACGPAFGVQREPRPITSACNWTRETPQVRAREKQEAACDHRTLRLSNDVRCQRRSIRW